MDKLEITDVELKIIEIAQACTTYDATTRGKFSAVFRIFCFEDRFDVIERAPGVKIFHRGWQVGQTTQK